MSSRELAPELPELGHDPARVPWAVVEQYLRRTWQPGEHFSVIAPTGYGKSHLVTRGLLPQWRWTLILDVKGDDTTLIDSGHEPTATYPGRARQTYQTYTTSEPITHWRLFPGGYSRRHRPVFDDAFRRVWRSANPQAGTWVVYADEARLLAGSKYLALEEHLEAFWISGRSKGITLIAGTQAPRYVPSAFYEQARWLAIGQIRDKRAQRRLAEIGGDTDMLMRVVPRLRWREFLFLGPQWSVITTAPAR